MSMTTNKYLQFPGQEPAIDVEALYRRYRPMVLRRCRQLHDSELLDRLPSGDEPETAVVNRDLVYRLFEGERSSTHEIATLRLMQGFSLDETAERIGLSVSGVRKRLAGLRRRGVALLSAWGGCGTG